MSNQPENVPVGEAIGVALVALKAAREAAAIAQADYTIAHAVATDSRYRIFDFRTADQAARDVDEAFDNLVRKTSQLRAAKLRYEAACRK